MDEFIKLLDPAYELIQYRIKEDKVIFHIASTITELECPFCGRKMVFCKSEHANKNGNKITEQYYMHEEKEGVCNDGIYKKYKRRNSGDKGTRSCHSL